jgi:hypothetical protein
VYFPHGHDKHPPAMVILAELAAVELNAGKYLLPGHAVHVLSPVPAKPGGHVMSHTLKSTLFVLPAGQNLQSLR